MRTDWPARRRSATPWRARSVSDCDIECARAPATWASQAIMDEPRSASRASGFFCRRRCAIRSTARRALGLRTGPARRRCARLALVLSRDALARFAVAGFSVARFALARFARARFPGGGALLCVGVLRHARVLIQRAAIRVRRIAEIDQRQQRERRRNDAEA